jgi:hypothetical protein
VEDEREDGKPSEPQTDSRLRSWLILLAVLLVVLIGYRLLVPRQSVLAKTVPDAFHGTWITLDAEHSDWYVEIESDSILFGTGNVVGKRYRVIGYDREFLELGNVVHTIFFRDVDGTSGSKAFRHTPEDGGSLVFTDQPAIDWIRQREVVGSR